MTKTILTGPGVRDWDPPETNRHGSTKTRLSETTTHERQDC